MIFSVSVEMLMGVLGGFSGGIAFQDSGLEMGNLVEAVHVQLPDERVEFVVFEPFSKMFSSQTFLVKN